MISCTKSDIEFNRCAEDTRYSQVYKVNDAKKNFFLIDAAVNYDSWFKCYVFIVWDLEGNEQTIGVASLKDDIRLVHSKFKSAVIGYMVAMKIVGLELA